MPANGPLSGLLKGQFGFDSFLPLQEEIIADALAGRDVFALLPTGGGKSYAFSFRRSRGRGSRSSSRR